MRIPIPTNRLVALTLLGALLTGVVSLGLTAPGLLPGSNDVDDATGGNAQVAADSPAPNPDFTPAVRTPAGYEEHEEGPEDREGEYEEGEAYEGEGYEEGEDEEYDD